MKTFVYLGGMYFAKLTDQNEIEVLLEGENIDIAFSIFSGKRRERERDSEKVKNAPMLLLQ